MCVVSFLKMVKYFPSEHIFMLWVNTISIYNVAYKEICKIWKIWSFDLFLNVQKYILARKISLPDMCRLIYK